MRQRKEYSSIPQARAHSSAQPQDHADDLISELAAVEDERIAALGAETRATRRVKRVVPWATSAVIHVLLVIVAFFITWSVVNSSDREDIIVVAEFDSLSYEPVQLTDEQEQHDDKPSNTEQAELQPPELEISPELLAPVIDPADLLSIDESQTSIDALSQPTTSTVSFVGLRSSNARRIVYVIDASGSMIRSLQFVVKELKQSLDQLHEQQSFAIVFFQKNSAIMAPPRNRLQRATGRAKLDALEWIEDNVIPSGRSNPVEALRQALDLNPHVIFLLSQNITGSGEFEIDQADLLAILDKENPINDETGRRRAQINCVQFLDPDPLKTLERIAEVHGGQRGYRFLDRTELGVSTP